MGTHWILSREAFLVLTGSFWPHCGDQTVRGQGKDVRPREKSAA